MPATPMPAPAPALVMIEGPGMTPGQSYPIRRVETVLGRELVCDHVVDVLKVSKKHVRIVRQPDGYWAEDLRSKNGTELNDRPLIGPARLRHGDVLTVGKVVRLAFHWPVVSVLEGPDDETAILGVLDTPIGEGPLPLGARPGEALRAMLEISRDLVGVQDLGVALDRVLGALFRVFPQADRAFVLLGEPGTTRPSPRAIRCRDEAPAELLLSRTVLNHVLGSGKAILSMDLGADSQFSMVESVMDSQVRTMLCVPVWDGKRRPVGMIQVDTIDHVARFDQDDLDVMVAVAAQVSVAAENDRLQRSAIRAAKLEQDLEYAREVHRALLPRRRPELAGYEFFDAFQPASYVGGDYFDYIPLARPGSRGEEASSRWALALGDVAGKGFAAALLMARLCAQVRLLLETQPDPARFLAQLDADLCATGTADRIITFLLAILDGERHELSVVNAGHPRVLVRRADGRIESIGEDDAGLPLAAFGDQVFRVATVPIGAGDVVVIYTDGVIEATDGADRFFQLTGLLRALAAAPARPAEVGAAIVEAVRAHVAGGEPHDDITLLCFGRT